MRSYTRCDFFKGLERCEFLPMKTEKSRHQPVFFYARAGSEKTRAGSKTLYTQMSLVGQRRPALPRTNSAVPSALGGLTSGFGMGPGVPPLP